MGGAPPPCLLRPRERPLTQSQPPMANRESPMVTSPSSIAKSPQSMGENQSSMASRHSPLVKGQVATITIAISPYCPDPLTFGGGGAAYLHVLLEGRNSQKSESRGL